MAPGATARASWRTVLMCGAALALVAGCGGATGSPAATQAAAATLVTTAGPTATSGAATTTVPVVTAAATCVAPPAGIVSWWRAENDARDAVGGHDGALQGGATFAAGMVGQAFSFDGATQFVSVSPSSALQLKTGITLEAWVYETGDQSHYAGIAGTWDDNSGAFRTYLFWVQGQTLELVVSTDLSSYQRAPGVDPFPTDRWVHVAGTYDGTTIRLYRDGVEVASTAMAGQIAVNDKPFLIGRAEGGSVGPNFWKGSIDELTVYDHALTAAELAAIHAAGSAGKCRP